MPAASDTLWANVRSALNESRVRTEGCAKKSPPVNGWAGERLSAAPTSPAVSATTTRPIMSVAASFRQVVASWEKVTTVRSAGSNLISCEKAPSHASP
jgi:hypothetical protein